MSRISLSVGAAALFFAWSPASAHPGHFGGLDFISGFSHPLSGFDHVLAMIGVGLLSVTDRSAAWRWPLVFLGAMAVGGGLGMASSGVEWVEPLLTASVILLGIAIAVARHIPPGVKALGVAVFGAAHGIVHGGNAAALAGLTKPYAYFAGFLAATAALHLAGVLIGRSAQAGRSAFASRLLGCGIAGVGIALATGP